MSMRKRSNTKEYLYLYGVFPGNPGEDNRVIKADRGVFVETDYYINSYEDITNSYLEKFFNIKDENFYNIEDFPKFEVIPSTVNLDSKVVDYTTLDPVIVKDKGIIKEPEFMNDITFNPYLKDYLDCVRLTDGTYLAAIKEYYGW